jgi:hypothetical protein
MYHPLIAPLVLQVSRLTGLRQLTSLYLSDEYASMAGITELAAAFPHLRRLTFERSAACEEGRHEVKAVTNMLARSTS